MDKWLLRYGYYDSLGVPSYSIRSGNHPPWSFFFAFAAKGRALPATDSLRLKKWFLLRIYFISHDSSTAAHEDESEGKKYTEILSGLLKKTPKKRNPYFLTKYPDKDRYLHNYIGDGSP